MLHVTHVLLLSFHRSSSFLFFNYPPPRLSMLSTLYFFLAISPRALYFFLTLSSYITQLWMDNCENYRAKLRRGLRHQNTTATKACERHRTKTNAATSEQCNTNTPNNKLKKNESGGVAKSKKNKSRRQWREAAWGKILQIRRGNV